MFVMIGECVFDIQRLVIVVTPVQICNIVSDDFADLHRSVQISNIVRGDIANLHSGRTGVLIKEISSYVPKTDAV